MKNLFNYKSFLAEKNNFVNEKKADTKVCKECDEKECKCEKDCDCKGKKCKCEGECKCNESILESNSNCKCVSECKCEGDKCKCEKACQCTETVVESIEPIIESVIESCECDLNEGLLGKIEKLISKKEYDKTLDHVMSKLEDDDCTKENVKKAMSNMVFSKLTKNAIDDDSMFMKSLIDEIYKDCKKECDKKSNESIVFGTDEWNKKYGVKVDKEETKTSLKSVVNETVKIKNIEEFSLNEKVNQIIDENKIQNDLNTIKK